jgi:ABC-type polysaccharide/polyol phosphate transport system ATPase subunit
MARQRIQGDLAHAITFEGVGISMPKEQRRGGSGRRHRLRRLAGEVSRTQSWMLRDVNAWLDAGEIVAIIGVKNGGREELLRLAAGTLLPDVGRVTQRSTVVPLISIARTLNRRMTIRQNIYVLGGLLGMSPHQVTASFEAIVDQAGVRSGLDRHLGATPTPIRQRLAWAIGMATHAKIFAIDQVMAAGEATAVQASWEQIARLRDEGTAFMIVSDDLARLREVCDRALFVGDGTVQACSADQALELLRKARRKSTRRTNRREYEEFEDDED